MELSKYISHGTIYKVNEKQISIKHDNNTQVTILKVAAEGSSDIIYF